MKIGIDLMGSESPVDLLFSGVEMATRELPDTVCYQVYLTADALENIKKKYQALSPNISFQVVDDFITQGEEPLVAMRLKKKSSMVVGVKQLKEKRIDAFVSAGNTGALIALSSIFLPKLPHIDRPALLALMPSKKEPFALIDVGGFISFRADQLVQFARMGAAYQKLRFGIERPTVALLNIGRESKKGTIEHREAFFALESDLGVNFIGNIEGRDIFRGEANVVVTDGFSGNIMLKTAEGISGFIFELARKIISDAASESLEKELLKLRKYFSYEEYPGAIVCGIDAIGVKCHGAITERGILNSVKEVHRLIETDFIRKIKG